MRNRSLGERQFAARSFRRCCSYDGQLFLVFVALQESGKALLERFRADTWSPTSEALLPAVSATFAIVAITALAVNAWRAAAGARQPAALDAGARSP